jgi:UPF0716 protein FxsA
MALFILLLPFIEVYGIYQVGLQIGALNTLGFLILNSFLGLSIIKSQGLALVRQSQESFARGDIPKGASFIRLLTIFAGFLFLIPGFFTDIIGFLCLLPGSRHLIAFIAQKWIKRQIEKGRVRFFGGGAAPGGFSTFGQDPFTHSNNHERDVSPQVIDVTPIKVTKSTNESDDGSGTPS